MKISGRIQKKDESGRTFFLVLICFLYLYSFKIPGMSLGTVLPMLVVMTVYSVFSFFCGKKIEKLGTTQMVKKYLLWNALLLAYVYLLLQFWGSGNGTSPLKDYSQMLIILPIVYISGNLIFRDLEELMKVLYIGVIIQSIIIIAALFLPILTLFLFSLIPEGAYNSEGHGGIEMITRHGYRIGLGVFTSAGSVKMAIGQIGACFFLIKKQGTNLYLHFVFFFIIAIATSLLSRTGLLFSIVALIVVLYAKSKQQGFLAVNYGVKILGILAVSYVVLSEMLPAGFYEDTFKRFIDLSDRGIEDTYFAGFTGEYGDNVIPPVSSNTLIGLGITKGVSGSGIVTNTDGGFLRNYSAMGLIVAIINYILIANIFKRRYKRAYFNDNKSLILLILLFLMIGEFKEYCIYFIFPMCFTFLCFSLIERGERHACRY